MSLNYEPNTLDSQAILFQNHLGDKIKAMMNAWPVLQVGLSPIGELLPVYTPASPSALSSFRSLTVDSTAQAIKASAGTIQNFNLVNRHSAAVYFRFYNIAAGSVNPASSVPVLTILVPATDTKNFQVPKYFGTAISVRAVTDATDTGTTAPATLPIIELEYK